MGRGPSAPISEAGKASRDPRKPPTPGSGLSPGEARSPGRRLRGIPAGRGGKAGSRRVPVAPRDPGLQSRRRGFPGLGGRRLPSSHAVTASDVSASPRTEGTRGGAGFWGSRELCPLSCSKKPNQKANLCASTPNVTLSAGRERAARNDKPRVSVLARAWGEFSDRFPAGRVRVEPAPRRVQRDPRANADTAPRPRPPAQPSEPGSSGPAVHPRRRHVLTWIPPSPELRAAGREGRQRARGPAFPLSLGDVVCNSEIEFPPNICGFLNIAGGRLPRQGPPRSRGGVEEGAKIKLLLTTTPLFFPPAVLGAELSLSFSQPKSNNSL